MKFYISKIYIWFDKDVKPRIMDFDNNKVNVITGSSSTGKSNIYSIIDYCLLSWHPNIVYPVINENAKWYGLEFFLNGEQYAIARKKPTVEVIPPDLFLQTGEAFPEGFYPSSPNIHINDARKILDKAFGYKEHDKLLFRSSFVFNALTESIITSPYDFLNFKFYDIEAFSDTSKRQAFIESALTPNVEEYAKVSSEIDDLNKKKQKYDNHRKSLEKINDEFNRLLNELVGLCIQSNLLPESIQETSEEAQIQALEKLLEENTLSKEEQGKIDKELRELQNVHSRISIQLTNIKMAQAEQSAYIQSLEQVEDSLKPVRILRERLNEQGINMWTSHVVNSLNNSLSKITAGKEKIEHIPIVSETIIEKLKCQLEQIEEKISLVTKQKGSLYQQVDKFKVIGILEAKIGDLKQEWNNKVKKASKDVEIFSEDYSYKLSVLEQKKAALEQQRLNTIPEFNKCIQHIFDGFHYMEHYENCYTKFDLKQERLMLNDGKSILNYDVIGSQSNYMFLHLCFFLGLHRYFFENIKLRHIGQFLFIDQPSIPYYAGSDNVKTTDKEKLLDAFKSINDFMKYVIEERNQQFQVILVEHAPESYWTGENHLNYFVTKEQFTAGNALIPQYVLNKTTGYEN